MWLTFSCSSLLNWAVYSKGDGSEIENRQNLVIIDHGVTDFPRNAIGGD